VHGETLQNLIGFGSTFEAIDPGYDVGRARPWRAGQLPKGRDMERGFYVQVRYPHAQRWETVAVSATRGVAAGLAGDMYRDLRNDVGQSPVQVRIASHELLHREGGDTAIRDAAEELWRRAQAVSHAAADPEPTPPI
jgi:hypothetical protein